MIDADELYGGGVGVIWKDVAIGVGLLGMAILGSVYSISRLDQTELASEGVIDGLIFSASIMSLIVSILYLSTGIRL